MARIDLRPELEGMIKTINTKNTYYGNKISDSIMRLITVEIREDGAGILAPFWLSVLQRGRGVRKSNKSSGLWKIIYEWMRRRNMFRSRTEKGKINEAKFLTWYINKYGNKQFRNKVFIDIYEKAREETMVKVMDKYKLEVGKITFQIL